VEFNLFLKFSSNITFVICGLTKIQSLTLELRTVIWKLPAQVEEAVTTLVRGFHKFLYKPQFLQCYGHSMKKQSTLKNYVVDFFLNYEIEIVLQ